MNELKLKPITISGLKALQILEPEKLIVIRKVAYDIVETMAAKDVDIKEVIYMGYELAEYPEDIAPRI